MIIKSGKIVTIIAVLVLILVLSALPMGSALAANGPVDISVTVKNMTGGTVTLHLVDEDGASHWFTFEGQGQYKVSVPEGHYSYYASTPCGSESGQMNLNVSKLLKFNCEDGVGVSLTKPEGSCEMVLWVGAGIDWFETNPEWWEYLLSNPYFEAEMKCLDPNLKSVFTPYIT